MGNPAYDARREAERVEAERDKAAAEAGKLAFECITDFFAGRSRLVIDRIEDGVTTVRFQR